MEGQKRLEGDNDMCFLEKLKALYVTGDLTDVEFVLGSPPCVYRSHRFVLSLASDVFCAMFYGKLQEKGLIVRIEDVSPEAFGNILEYIYTNEVSIKNCEEALATAYATKKYMLSPKLMDVCVQSVEGYINYNYIWDAFEASILLEHPRLRPIVKYHLVTNFDKISSSEDFLSCSEAHLEQFLESVAAYIAPNLLFNALINWAKNKKASTLKEIRTLLKPFLRHVRFLAMTTEQFMRTLGANYIVTDKEFTQICLSIARDRCTSLAPTWLNLTRIVWKIGHEYIADFSVLNVREVTANNAHLVSSFQVARNSVFLKGVIGWARTTGSRLPPSATLTYINHTTNFKTSLVCKVEPVKDDFQCLMLAPRLLNADDSVTLSLHLCSEENTLTFNKGRLNFKKYSLQAGKVTIQTHPVNDCAILKGVIFSHIL